MRKGVSLEWRLSAGYWPVLVSLHSTLNLRQLSTNLTTAAIVGPDFQGETVLDERQAPRDSIPLIFRAKSTQTIDDKAYHQQQAHSTATDYRTSKVKSAAAKQ